MGKPGGRWRGSPASEAEVFVGAEYFLRTACRDLGVTVLVVVSCVGIRGVKRYVGARPWNALYV